jgi:hypothetical protein
MVSSGVGTEFNLWRWFVFKINHGLHCIYAMKETRPKIF